jgi:hypothetical protein
VTLLGTFAHGHWTIEVEAIVGDVLFLRRIDTDPTLPVALRDAAGLHVTAYLTADATLLAAGLERFLAGLPAGTCASAGHSKLPPERRVVAPERGGPH